MIVLCPSCSTHFRHEPALHSAATFGECSRCDERFPISAPRRSYVLLPRRAAAGRAPVAGYDDPPLAPRAARTRPEPAPVPAKVAAARPGPAPGLPQSSFAEFLVAVVPPSLGASVAYYVAVRDQLDPVAWAALGGAAGFVLGWGCLLWMRRKD